MAITTPIDDHAALIAAACCNPSPSAVDMRDCFLRIIRIANTYFPWFSIRVWTNNTDITTKVNKSVFDTFFHTERSQGVGGILFYITAKIKLHTFRKCDIGIVPAQFLPTDQIEGLSDFFLTR